MYIYLAAGTHIYIYTYIYIYTQIQVPDRVLSAMTFNAPIWNENGNFIINQKMFRVRNIVNFVFFIKNNHCLCSYSINRLGVGPGLSTQRSWVRTSEIRLDAPF